MPNILVTGGSGILAMEFKSLSSYHFSYNFFFTSSNELDITDHHAFNEYIVEKEIDIIINCAAYTFVDKAESEQKQANAINHLAVANMARAAKDNSVNLIHISTDYVFDGLKDNPYIESDPTNPQTVYGKTKLKGEMAIKRINPKDSIIIRTSWLFSKFGNNFVKKMLELSKTNKQIKVVSDQIGSPTCARDLAIAILKILPKIKNSDVDIYHFSNKGSCSWYEFAKIIFKTNNIDISVVSVNYSNYPSKINRPKFSVLSTSKIETKYGLNIQSWTDALKNHFELVNK